ncbi:DgyrCDS10635 [Dimorphilus gyrociliatus]|uniref:Cytidine deaminase n=1 Tax=Dimorphilus gyrociliatus TaxID=2664684 RepID=A0A7I8W0T8_9ANNE|nr:DgyrCDS10635 [Dimorphilus gyrociliatus]
MTELSPTIRELIDSCQKAKGNAYCPYSNFRVGSAVLTESGHIFYGSNVENASYGLTICAERCALSSAICQGHRKFKAIAVCTDLEEFKAPCGACRQFIIEFGIDLDYYMVNNSGEFKKMDFAPLVPLPFAPESLQQSQNKV